VRRCAVGLLVASVVFSMSCSKPPQYLEAIGEGLTRQFNCLYLPHGKIFVLSEIVARNEGINIAKRRYPPDYTETLDKLEALDLIHYEEVPQNIEDQVLLNMGSRIFNVNVTRKAVDLGDREASDHEWTVIPLGQCFVRDIVKDMEYKHPTLPTDEDYRVVMGFYEVRPNDLGREFGGIDRRFRFRALIKLNPFDDSYSFVAADWGEIDKDNWETDNLP